MRRLFVGITFLSMLAGCGDPLRNVPRISDVAASGAATTVAETPAEARQTGGLFGRLTSRRSDDPTNAAVEAALQNTPSETIALPDVDTLASAQVDVERPRGGLGGIFRRGNNRPSLARTGPDAADVAAGTILPFGQIARVCGALRSELGTRVDSSAGFHIFDSFPNSTAARPFYITGFDDDCARTFTGAVVVTGDAMTHEFVRYQPSNERIEYSTTDNAYEALKASVCRVGRGQPCGARADRLNQNTAFVTVYDFFGGTFSAVPTEWAQILVHDGAVLAMSLKDG